MARKTIPQSSQLGQIVTKELRIIFNTLLSAAKGQKLRQSSEFRIVNFESELLSLEDSAEKADELSQAAYRKNSRFVLEQLSSLLVFLAVQEEGLQKDEGFSQARELLSELTSGVSGNKNDTETIAKHIGLV